MAARSFCHSRLFLSSFLSSKRSAQTQGHATRSPLGLGFCRYVAGIIVCNFNLHDLHRGEEGIPVSAVPAGFGSQRD